ncbi:hypothetical protein U1Q18_004568 [Sarracenia purpurea var. burkii]
MLRLPGEDEPEGKGQAPTFRRQHTTTPDTSLSPSPSPTHPMPSTRFASILTSRAALSPRPPLVKHNRASVLRRRQLCRTTARCAVATILAPPPDATRFSIHGASCLASDDVATHRPSRLHYHAGG